MIAYNREWLHNQYAREQLDEAYTNGCISKEKHDELLAAMPVSLYTPNIFIRIGLALLTIVIVVFSCGLLFLLTDGVSGGYGTLLIVAGLLSYGALELMVNSKQHYNSGVDNILMVATTLFISMAIYQMTYEHGIRGNISTCFSALVISAWLAYRFADSFMASAATILGILLLLYLCSGILPALLLFPLGAVASYIVYAMAQKVLTRDTNFIFHFILQSIALTGLILFYLAGNVMAVDGISEGLFSKSPAARTAPVAVRFLFWAWTLLLPVLYALYGIRKRDIVLIRTGVLLCTIAVFTYRAYFSLMSVEVAMILGGGILIVLSYVLIKYLKEPRSGFTFDPPPASKTELNVEDLITEKLIHRAGQ